VSAFDAAGREIGVVFATATPFDTPRLMEATDITGANRNTVKVHLRRLTEMGHLVKHGAGRAVWYVIA
jgi:hypothetical protein